MAYPMVRCTCVLLLLFPAFGMLLAKRAQQPSISASDVAEVKFFVHRTGNEWVGVPKEISSRDLVPTDATSPYGTCQSSVNVARLPGSKAEIRFKKDEVVELRMEAPVGSGPGAMELLHYDNRGKQRWAYLTCYRGTEGVRDYSEQAFKGARVSNTEWRLRPSVPLTPGEYCFKVRASDDNFCFGVDKK